MREHDHGDRERGLEQMRDRFHERLQRGQMPTPEEIKKHRLQMLVVIVDRSKNQKVVDVLQEIHVHLHFVCLGEGTASSEIMDLLGLGSTDKALTFCIGPKTRMAAALGLLTTRLKLYKPGKGIAFTVPLTGVSSPVLQMLDHEIRDSIINEFEKEVEKVSSGAKHDLILAVINQGCTEDLMAAAKKAGARGGTIVHARRISSENTVKFFGIAVQAEKEVVAILTTREKKHDIMKAIGSSCGMRSEAGGIFLSLPVDEIAGLAEAADPEEDGGKDK